MKKYLTVLIIAIMVCMSVTNIALASSSDTELEAPVITEAKFYHKGVISSLQNRLQILWTEVEDANSYEIEITKGDGTVTVYTSVANSFMLQNSTCPKIKIGTSWVSATVKIRAVSGDIIGPWSDPDTIGCDTIHK